MTTRYYRKNYWQADSDCHWINFAGRAQRLVIARLIPEPEPYSREPGLMKVRRPGQRGAFRYAYLGKAVRWLRRAGRKALGR